MSDKNILRFAKNSVQSAYQPADRGDVANAVRFAALWAEKVIFVPQLGKWFEFVEEKHKWVQDEMGLMTQHAISTTRQLMLDAAKLLMDAAMEGGNESEKKSKTFEAQELTKEARAGQSKPRLDAMLSLAATDPAIAVSQSQIDSNKMKIGCESGVIELETGTHRQGEPADLITRSIPVHFNYKAHCPTWERFLEEVQPDHEVRKYLQKLSGYCLTGLTVEQMFVVLHGTGANGKSVFTETLKRMMGGYSATTSFDTFAAHPAESIRNDLARLNKIRLVVASESNDAARLDEALIKNVTGGEKITARFLHKEYFEFTPNFKILLVTNHLPKIQGTDHGIWRRVVLVPWKVTIEDDKKDKDLPRKLADELPGILNWCLEGLKMYQSEGLALPKVLENARSCYKKDSDDVADWFEDCLQINDQARSELTSLAESYREWAKKLGRPLVSDKRLSERLSDMPQLHALKMPMTKRRAFQGVAIRV